MTTETRDVSDKSHAHKSLLSNFLQMNQGEQIFLINFIYSKRLNCYNFSRPN